MWLGLCGFIGLIVCRGCGWWKSDGENRESHSFRFRINLGRFPGSSWVSPSTLVSCGQWSSPKPFISSVRPDVAASSRQSSPEMQGDAEFHHAIYSELRRDARGPSSVHALTGATWRCSNSRIVAPPPCAVIGLLAERLNDGESVADILDAVSAARVANSVRDSPMAAY